MTQRRAVSESDPLSADRPDTSREFRVDAPFDPAGDQSEAIKAPARGFREGVDVQALLGVTDSGKINTVSWVVEEIQKPTLVLAHNKTLATQLHERFKGLFPDNAVEYFVSYYDYYQLETHIEQADTYIDKDMSVNEEVGRLRHSVTRSLLIHDDVTVVASASAIYSLGDPKDYTDMPLRLEVGQGADRGELLRALVNLNYEHNDVDLRQGTFRIHGDTVEMLPMYGHYAVRTEFRGDEIDRMLKLDPPKDEMKSSESAMLVHPAKHYSIPEEQLEGAIPGIEELTEQRVKYFQRQGDPVAAQCIEERTTFDIEMLRETGHCSDIESYSVHLSDREPGDMSHTLLDYFPDDFLTVIDESYAILPQIRGQHTGDKSRKDSLVENGFRLPTAYNNRPLAFEKLGEIVGRTLFAPATPDDYGRECSDQIVEQIVWPTHLADPKIEATKAARQADDLMARTDERIDRDERVFAMALMKRMAEDLTEYFEETGADVAYMHDETDTLERHELIRSLRLNDIDVLVGINLLRKGLNIPEVSLVAIPDADQQGFLRSETTLVQAMGHAAHNVNGEVVLYADEMTDVMEAVTSETQHRRHVKREFNEEHGYTPTAIEREVGETNLPGSKVDTHGVSGDGPADADEAVEQITFLESRMQKVADNLEFELATDIRDHIRNLRHELDMDALEDDVMPECPDEYDGEAGDSLTPPDEF